MLKERKREEVITLCNAKQKCPHEILIRTFKEFVIFIFQIKIYIEIRWDHTLKHMRASIDIYFIVRKSRVKPSRCAKTLQINICSTFFLAPSPRSITCLINLSTNFTVTNGVFVCYKKLLIKQCNNVRFVWYFRDILWTIVEVNKLQNVWLLLLCFFTPNSAKNIVDIFSGFTSSSM